MKRLDKAYWSAWVLLSVFIPMVLLSSLHVHPELLVDGQPCHECIDHTVHNGHIAAIKASVDCPLCAFQSNAYQPEDEVQIHYSQPCCRVKTYRAVPLTVAGFQSMKQSRAPPFTFCA
ncbi:MAG: hypothetical protein IJV05_06795 [Muribaculaceae bacterium]|nr:hypothetical protein [Muribaculaceae bacterium]